MFYLDVEQIGDEDQVFYPLAAENRYSDTGLSPNTTYCYAVSAYDAAGNESNLCTEECATTEVIGCGTGLPLVISELDFPSSVSRGSFQSGTVAYEGSYEDIFNPVMVNIMPTGTGTIYSAMISTPVASDCRLDFEVAIPDNISGTGLMYFVLIDYDDAIGLYENDENLHVTNRKHFKKAVFFA